MLHCLAAPQMPTTKFSRMRMPPSQWLTSGWNCRPQTSVASGRAARRGCRRRRRREPRSQGRAWRSSRRGSSSSRTPASGGPGQRPATIGIVRRRCARPCGRTRARPAARPCRRSRGSCRLDAVADAEDRQARGVDRGVGPRRVGLVGAPRASPTARCPWLRRARLAAERRAIEPGKPRPGRICA